MCTVIMFAMSGNRTLNCAHFNASNSTSDADKFAISMSCALFDFLIYTLAMGTLTILSSTLRTLLHSSTPPIHGHVDRTGSAR